MGKACVWRARARDLPLKYRYQRLRHTEAPAFDENARLMSLCINNIGFLTTLPYSNGAFMMINRWRKVLLDLYMMRIASMRLRPLDRTNDVSCVRRTLSSFSETDCYVEFRFRKSDIVRLLRCFHIPDVVWVGQTGHEVKFAGEELMLFFLKRMAYPDRLYSISRVWGRDYSAWSKGFSWMVHFFHRRWGYLLTDMLSFWEPYFSESAMCLEEKARTFPRESHRMNYVRGSFNVCAFIDCSSHQTQRVGSGPAAAGAGAPRKNKLIQRSHYNGWKSQNGAKGQTLMLANGMTIDAFYGVSVRQNDLTVLRLSTVVERFAACQQGNERQYIIYGDSIYPTRSHLTSRHPRLGITDEEKRENRCMSSLREAIEWEYADISRLWGYTAFTGSLKMLKAPVTKIFIAATILKNAHVTVNGCEASIYFNMQPPSLEEWTSRGPA
jgi:DDE superfamily endonuclease